MKKILLLFLLLICGCKNSKIQSIDKKIEMVMAENNYIIVDVRTKEEYSQGHILNSINIPIDEINDTLTLDKNKTILVYCQSGNRSSMAYNILVNLGYDVYDLGAFSSIDLPKE